MKDIVYEFPIRLRLIKSFLFIALICFFNISCAHISKFNENDTFIKNSECFNQVNYIGDEKYIVVDGIRVCYVDNLSKSKDTIIFLHGLSLSINNFRYNYPYFFDKYRVIALDLPGFGKSDYPDVSYSIEFLTRFVERFMGKIGVNKAVFVGNSLGAHVALELAVDYPDKVEALVIGGSTGLRFRFGIIEDALIDWYITEDRFKNLSEKQMRAHIEWSFYNRSVFSEELVKHRVLFRRKYFGSKIYDDNNRAFVKGLLHVIKDDVRGKVGLIKSPTLIVWGEHDSVTRISDAYFLNKQIKGSELKIIKNAGHLAHLERFEDYNKVVSDFLSKNVINR